MEIYEPAEDSELLAKYVKKLVKGKVLEIGTGSGIQAITAFKKKSVKKVLAVDINQKAVDFVKERIKKDNKKKNKENINNKITVKKSNLFSNIKEKFDFVIFNPPYLPQDKGIKDLALYGGKKGWEILDRFFSQANKYLSKDGQILVVFSSLTNKNRIHEIIEQNLFEFKELEKQRLPMFEELYVYKIWKSDILKKLERKRISDIKYLTHGKRGNVFIGNLKTRKIKNKNAIIKNKKVAIKIKRKESKAIERIKNEVKWLKILNKKRIGPKLISSGKDFLIIDFIVGEFLPLWLKKAKKSGSKEVIINILKQCFEMDKLGVNKEEMHRPLKHVIVNKSGKPTLIDFERCYKTKKPHNVTQFGVFLMRNKLVNRKKIVEILKEYKNNQTKENFDKIIKQIKA